MHACVPCAVCSVHVCLASVCVHVYLMYLFSLTFVLLLPLMIETNKLLFSILQCEHCLHAAEEQNNNTNKNTSNNNNKTDNTENEQRVNHILLAMVLVLQLLILTAHSQYLAQVGKKSELHTRFIHGVVHMDIYSFSITDHYMCMLYQISMI